MDATVPAYDIEVPPGCGMMHELHAVAGDYRATWDRSKPEEVALARQAYDELARQGYRAYAESKRGKRRELLTRFDPDAERIVLIPQLAGG
jgi:hypothetical protein